MSGFEAAVSWIVTAGLWGGLLTMLGRVLVAIDAKRRRRRAVRRRRFRRWMLSLEELE